MASYKNTSNGGGSKGNTGNHFSKIGDNKAHVPPAGASIDSKDDSALAKMPYTREKMMNK